MREPLGDVIVDKSKPLVMLIAVISSAAHFQARMDIRHSLSLLDKGAQTRSKQNRTDTMYWDMSLGNVVLT